MPADRGHAKFFLMQTVHDFQCIVTTTIGSTFGQCGVLGFGCQFLGSVATLMAQRTLCRLCNANGAQNGQIPESVLCKGVPWNGMRSDER